MTADVAYAMASAWTPRKVFRHEGWVGSGGSHSSRCAAFLPFVAGISFPAIELNLVRPGCAFPCFEKRFEA